MPRLTLDIVPASTWYDNLRSRLRPSEWDRLRKATYAAAGHRCEVCGGRGSRHPVEAHERWDYDEENLVQRLIGLIALCPSCHAVKHFGRSQAIGQGGKALAHLKRVNRWKEDQAWDHINRSFEDWQRRSSVEWTLDLSWLEQPLPVAIDPAIAELFPDRSDP